MAGSVRRRSGLRAWGRGAAVAAAALSATACASIQNLAPDPGTFRLPDRSTFLPSNTSAFSRSVSSLDAPVGPNDLVDGQGNCPGAASISSDAPTVRGVNLEMTECEVVRALGPPQATEIGGQPGGGRAVALTYTSGERSGIYRFNSGRLVTVERGNEPPPPVAAKKPAPKKPKPAQPPA
jgi:hypothetical protein